MTLMQRRRALMAQGGGIPPLIPDQTYTFTYDGITATISDGHHIKLDFTNIDERAWGFINISDMSKNGPTIGSTQNVNNINSTLVSFPTGSSATITATNFTKTPSEVLSQSTGQLTIGCRKSSSNITAISGVGYLSANNIVQSNTVSFATATDASCLFVYLQNIKANASIEFDVGLSINGQKVI